MNTKEYQSLGKCCPIFETERWDDKTLDWYHKNFIKSSIPTFFHMPFPPMIGRKITKMVSLAEKVDALAEDKLDSLLLFRDPHAFKSEIYLSVEKYVPEANNQDLTGKFISKVFDGKYKEIPKFIKQMNADLDERNLRVKDYYIHYAYCPKCSKEAGHNYVVLFAQVA